MGEIFFYWLTKGHRVANSQLGVETTAAYDRSCDPQQADIVWPRNISPLIGGLDSGGDLEFLSSGTLDPLEEPYQQRLDQQVFVSATNLHSSGNHGLPSGQAVEFRGAAQGFHRLNHYHDGTEVGKKGIDYLRESNRMESQLMATVPGDSQTSNAYDAEVASFTTDASIDLSSRPLQTNACACISCLGIGKSEFKYGESPQCRCPSCPDKLFWFTAANHERSHFREGSEYLCKEEYCDFATPWGWKFREHASAEHNHPITTSEASQFHKEAPYRCKEEQCNFTTKRWSDLERHVGSKHCTNPTKKFSCPIPWCRYSGNSGFARKDKLKSHYKTVHEGSAKSGKTNQAIKPKVVKEA